MDLDRGNQRCGLLPDASEDYEVQPATERSSRRAGAQSACAKVVKKLAGDWPQQASGVLIQQSGATRLAYEINLPIEPSAAAAAGQFSPSSVTGLVAPSL